ncbi:hypothetical protein PInf_004407 [Phytophthora infestans]|nr:hypothetical protein PInf_004407 [Phytophthora infestans]
MPRGRDRITKNSIDAWDETYFQYCESYDDSRMFNKLTDVDWKLLVEMEVITSFLADLARI